MTLRIAMWSGPRNLSTAMMRSFGARADTVVSDEPFYGAYLRHTGDDQAMKEQVIASMDCDWASVARAQNGQPPEARPKTSARPARLVYAILTVAGRAYLYDRRCRVIGDRCESVCLQC